MAEMTEGQRRAYESMLARVQERKQKREEVPRQPARAALQGASLGFSDEIEAKAKSLFSDRSYQEILDEIRGGLKAYKEARPMEALGYELGGAAVTGLIPGMQGSLLRAGVRGAAEGAAYAMGTGEGSIEERLARAPGGAVGGAVGGAAGYGAAKALGGLTNRLMDAARRTLGGRGSTIVENEIQRLVRQTERTPDQITQDIIDGRLLAENKSIQEAVRLLRAQGGEASTTIQAGMQDRPAQTRATAIEMIREGMGDVGEGSQAAIRRRSEAATKAAEREAYGQFRGTPESSAPLAPPDVVEALKNTLRRVPAASKEVEEALRAETGRSPFYEILEDGTVQFTREPTIMEAEMVRRAVGNRATALYQGSMGGAGESVSGVQQELRSVLDLSVPELATVRAQAAAVRTNRDAYKAGLKALTGDVNEKLEDFAEIARQPNSEEAIQAFRAGLLQTIQSKATRGTRQKLIRDLVNPEVAEGKLLLEVFPPDQIDDVLKTLDIAAASQEAAGRILIGTGSQTTPTQLEAARQGMGLSADDVANVMEGNVRESANVLMKMLRGMVRTGLTDAERARVAEILVSTDPQIVRNAIVDESGMARLAQAAERIAERLKGSGRTTGAVGGAMATEPVTEIFLPQMEVTAPAPRGLLE